MKPRALFRWIFWIVCGIIASGHTQRPPSSTPTANGGDTLTAIWWNVENFFDTIDDPGVLDEEFTPEGIKQWNRGRFWWKARMIAKGLLSASQGQPPDVIGLCEVENAQTVQALLSVLPWGWDYWSVHRDGPDPRGIDLVLLYRPDRIAIHGAHWVQSAYASREAICATLTTPRGDVSTMWLHLPSQYRPHPRRRLQAIRGYLDAMDNDGLDLMIGDFNASPSGPMGAWLRTEGWEPVAPTGAQGSYIYRGHWEELDQVWRSSSDIITRVDIVPFGLQIHNGRPRIHRTFQSMKYVGGASDHLPLRISVCLNDK